MFKRLFYFILFIIYVSHAYALNSDSLIEGLNDKWEIQTLLNIEGNTLPNNYRLVGVPDGIGAIRNGIEEVLIFMNHEISNEQGIVRLHGGRGSFVSEWKLDLKTKKISSGNDLIKKILLWDRDRKIFNEVNNISLNRLCSGDLPDQSAFYDPQKKLGFKDRIFLSGEEDRNGGRAFAHIVSGSHKGISYELPHLGKFSWENVVAHPKSGKKTIVMGMDDNKDGQVYLYLGEKKSKGNPIERAGLMYGTLYGIRVNGERFDLAKLGDVSNMSGSELENLGSEKNIARFKRPEDGAWDRLNKNVFYFATTDKIDGMSEIYKLTFDDINHPQNGGSIESILSASEIGAQMFDNLTVSDNGKLVIQEDPGDHEHLASIWEFDPSTKQATKLFSVKPEFFQDKSHPNFLTTDEEFPGIVDITKLLIQAPWYKKSERYFLGTLQVHKKIDDPELVEFGELYLISGPK